MADYERSIRELREPSFQKIRHLAINSIAHLSKEEHDVLWNELNRGVKLLDSHELLCQYLYSFGNMHQSKITNALNQMPRDVFYRQSIQIVDWGCGQGLATICLFDFLNQYSLPNNIKKVVLIEPAEMTLRRAALHIEPYINNGDTNAEIVALNRFLNDVKEEEIESEADATIHFFSNILDIESVNIELLAKCISNKINGEHYFVCVGPLNNANRRIDSFYNWFQTPQLIYEHSHNKDAHNYTAKYKIFKVERFNNRPVLVPYNPPVQLHAAYELDCVREALKGKENSDVLLKSLSSFEVSTPFDFGASIYEDVDSIYAVLNNIIVRGLPTKASPMIERAFRDFGNSEITNDIGGIVYTNSETNMDDLFLALHIIDGRLSLNNETYNTDILGSNLERHYINAVAPKVFQQILQPQRSLESITTDRSHYAQRVDFSIEYPYPTKDAQSFDRYGCVIEIDGDEYHSGEQILKDQTRDRSIVGKGWYCVRIKEAEIDSNRENNYYFLVANMCKIYSPHIIGSLMKGG